MLQPLVESKLSLLRPRADGDRSALRILLNARRSMDGQRTADRLALSALARTTALGIDARKALTDTQIRTVSAWRQGVQGDRADAVARAQARRLALAVARFTADLESKKASLAQIVEEMVLGLLDVPGVGPVTSVVIISAYSHRGRIRSEAAFAALGGVNPVPASSGDTLRHRLYRNGDRQLNQALDTIARSRMSFDPDTRDYVVRRTQEGKTRRDIRRCLKRIIARQLYRKINSIMS